MKINEICEDLCNLRSNNSFVTASCVAGSLNRYIYLSKLCKIKNFQIKFRKRTQKKYGFANK